MNKFSLLFLLLPLIQSHSSSDFSVEIKLISPFNRDLIQLDVMVKNQSSTSAMVLKNRTRDFKRNSSRSTGNYIIELEKWTGNGYYLWEPPAATIPTHRVEEEYIFLHKGKSIVDIIRISGAAYSNSVPSSFPAGLYRIRVSFNASESHNTQANISNWIEFGLQ